MMFRILLSFLLILLPIHAYSSGFSSGIKADSNTGASVTIDYEHHEAHAGDHFFFCNYTSLSDTGSVDIQMTTPNTSKYSHMVFQLQSTGATTLKVYEDASFVSGTSITARNNDRNSSTTATLTVQSDGSVTTTGTLISQYGFGYTNTPSSKVGGSIQRGMEMILKKNSKYRYFVESDSASNTVSYCAEWYEHTNP